MPLQESLTLLSYPQYLLHTQCTSWLPVQHHSFSTVVSGSGDKSGTNLQKRPAEILEESLEQLCSWWKGNMCRLVGLTYQLFTFILYIYIYIYVCFFSVCFWHCPLTNCSCYMKEGGSLNEPIAGFLHQVESEAASPLRGSLTAAYKCCVLHLTLCLMLIAIPELQLRRGCVLQCFSGWDCDACFVILKWFSFYLWLLIQT